MKCLVLATRIWKLLTSSPMIWTHTQGINLVLNQKFHRWFLARNWYIELLTILRNFFHPIWLHPIQDLIIPLKKVGIKNQIKKDHLNIAAFSKSRARFFLTSRKNLNQKGLAELADFYKWKRGLWMYIYETLQLFCAVLHDVVWIHRIENLYCVSIKFLV